MIRLWNGWCQFWFESQDSRKVFLFRSVFGFVFLLFALVRTPDVGFLFSNKGIMPLDYLFATMPMAYRYSFLYLNDSVTFAFALHGILIVSLLMLTFGVLPRLSALVALCLHVSFYNRNPLAFYGGDLIGTFYLFFMIFAEGSEIKGRFSVLRSHISSVVIRLAQLQLCFVYFYAGVEKLRGDQWWTGQAIWDVLANSQLATMDFAFMSAFPLLIAVLTLCTVLWEIYFPLGVWTAGARKPLLIIGVLLHIGIAITMGIPIFTMVMISIYIFFLKSAEIEGIFAFCQKVDGRIKNMKTIFRNTKVTRGPSDLKGV